MKIFLLKRTFSVFALFFIISLCFNTVSFAKKPEQVLIIPFTINSKEDLSFLQKGIDDMLSSRLYKKGAVTIISEKDLKKVYKNPKKKLDEKTAISLGKKLNANYVIYGSLTVFGNSLSTDAKIVDVKKKNIVLTLNEFGDSHGTFIEHINRFADKINKAVFSGALSKKVGEQSILGDNKYQNPELAWKKEQNKDQKVSNKTNQPLIENVTIKQKVTEPKGSLWKSKKFKTAIRSLAVGDVDGDGLNEIVFVDHNNIFIYRYVKNRFAKVAEIPGKFYNKYISVDVADINKNGKAEIFLSSTSPKNGWARSFIMEYNGKKFVKIENDTKWYYRAIYVPKLKEKILFGQKGGVQEVFYGGIYQIIWTGSKYEPKIKQNLPSWVNVFGFAYGDLMGKGKQDTIAYNNNSYLVLLDNENEEEWVSGEVYGGNSSFLVSPKEIELVKGNISGDPVPKNKKYLPQRIFVRDLNKDGKQEVITLTNSDLTMRLLSRVRAFRGGFFSSLEWNNVGLGCIWKTQTFSGYLSDFDVADMNNDGKQELIFSMVTNTTSIFQSSKSYIVTWIPDAKKTLGTK